jgi:hypothetical protein
LTATDVGPLTALFRVTPEEFTARRNQLVADLRRAGKSSEATAIAKLPRPTPAVWAANQVAHRDRAAVDRLLDAADRLKRAQLGHAPADVPAAAKAYREAVSTLVGLSLSQLKEAGRAATPATRSRLSGTLMAAASDPALREALREGRLTREQSASGFDVFADARPALRVVKAGAAPSPPPALSAPERDAVRRRAEAQLRLETARADLVRTESRARELANAAAEAARGAVEARHHAAAARRAAGQGRADVTRARAKVTAAEKAAKAP